MKHIQTFESFVNEAKGLFFKSSTDKWETPKEKGWYIQYKTESGDTSYVKVDKEPKNNADAYDMLVAINPVVASPPAISPAVALPSAAPAAIPVTKSFSSDHAEPL